MDGPRFVGHGDHRNTSIEFVLYCPITSHLGNVSCTAHASKSLPSILAGSLPSLSQSFRISQVASKQGSIPSIASSKICQLWVLGLEFD